MVVSVFKKWENPGGAQVDCPIKAHDFLKN